MTVGEGTANMAAVSLRRDSGGQQEGVMNGAEFVQTIIGEMHGAMMADVKDLTQEHVA